MTPEEMQKLMEAAKKRDPQALLALLGIRKPVEEAVPAVETKPVPSVPDERQLLRNQLQKISVDRGRKEVATVLSRWLQ